MRRKLLFFALTFAVGACSSNAVAPDTAGGSAGTNAGNGSGSGSGSIGASGSGSSNGSTGNRGSGSSGSTASTATSQGSTSTGSTGTSATSQGTSSTGSTGTSATSQGTSSTGSTGSTATSQGTSSTGSTGAAGSTGSTGTSATSAGGSSGSTGSTGAVPNGYIRAGDFVPLAFGADFCYRQSGSTGPYQGPVLRNAGVNAGVTYGQVTRYFAFPDPAPSGGTAYDIGLLLAGSRTCSNFQTSTTVTVVANTYTTVYGTGNPFGTPALAVQSAPDDSAPLTGNTAAFRFANASPAAAASAVDLGTSGSNAFATLFSTVQYPNVATNGEFRGSFGSVDGNGYLSFDSRALSLEVRSTPRVGTSGGSGGTSLATASITFAATARHSLFFEGDGSPQYPYKILDCTDDLTPASGTSVFTSCQ